MQLHPKTIEALKHKAEVAADTYDEADPELHGWKHTEQDCRWVATVGTTEALRSKKLALDELENYLNLDMPRSERVAIQRDLCRAGYYEVHDSEAYATGRAQCTGRIRTLMVDGALFEV